MASSAAAVVAICSNVTSRLQQQQQQDSGGADDGANNKRTRKNPYAGTTPPAVYVTPSHVQWTHSVSQRLGPRGSSAVANSTSNITDVTVLLDGTPEQQQAYIQGLLVAAMFIFGFFLVWMLVLIILKCCGHARVGFVSGQRLRRPLPPTPPVLSDCESIQTAVVSGCNNSNSNSNSCDHAITGDHGNEQKETKEKDLCRLTESQRAKRILAALKAQEEEQNQRRLEQQQQQQQQQDDEEAPQQQPPWQQQQQQQQHHPSRSAAVLKNNGKQSPHHQSTGNNNNNNNNNNNKDSNNNNTIHSNPKSPLAVIKYRIELKRWQKQAQETEQTQRQVRVVVIFCCLAVITNAILMMIYGLSAMQESMVKVQDGLQQTSNLATSAIHLVEEFLVVQDQAVNVTEQIMHNVNGICPSVQETLCRDILQQTDCNFTGIPYENEIQDVVNVLQDILIPLAQNVSSSSSSSQSSDLANKRAEFQKNKDFLASAAAAQAAAEAATGQVQAAASTAATEGGAATPAAGRRRRRRLDDSTPSSLATTTTSNGTAAAADAVNDTILFDAIPAVDATTTTTGELGTVLDDENNNDNSTTPATTTDPAADAAADAAEAADAAAEAAADAAAAAEAAADAAAAAEAAAEAAADAAANAPVDLDTLLQENDVLNQNNITQEEATDLVDQVVNGGGGAAVGDLIPVGVGGDDLDLDAICNEAVNQLGNHTQVVGDTLHQVQDALNQVENAMGQVEQVLDTVKYGLFNALTGAKSELQKVVHESDSMNQQVASYNWAFDVAAAFSLCLAVLSIFIIIGVVLAWRNKLHGSWFRWIRNLVVVPVFVLLVFASLVFCCVFVVGSIATSDVCYQSPDSLVMHVLETNLFPELKKSNKEFGPILADFISFYVQGCPAEVVPLDIDEMLRSKLNYVNDFVTPLQSVLASAEFTDICGSNSGLSSGMQVMLDIMCAVGVNVLDVRDLLNCNNWNSVYTTFAYDAVCYDATKGFVWICSTQLAIVFFAMMIVTLRVACYELEDEEDFFVKQRKWCASLCCNGNSDDAEEPHQEAPRRPVNAAQANRPR